MAPARRSQGSSSSKRSSRRVQLALAVCAWARLSHALVDYPKLAWTCPPADSPDASTEYDCYAQLDFCSGDDDVYGYQLPDSADECGSLAPLIVLTPGTKYKLRLCNTSVNATNLHTHGLHISGDKDLVRHTDDMTRNVNPGACIPYEWQLPESHMGGTFWYHAHKHTLVEKQVNGGAAGLLLVDNDAGDGADKSDSVSAWIKNEVLLMFATRYQNLTAAAGAGAATAVVNSVANGELAETVDMVADEWYRFRIANADLRGVASDIVFSEGCKVHAAAYDGVWRTSVPREKDSNTYSLTGASRLDLAVSCPAEATGTTITYGGTELVTLNVSEGETTAASPYADGDNTPWEPNRPAYLADLREETEVTENAIVVLDLTWNETVPLTGTDNQPFNSVELGVVQEWTLNTTAPPNLQLAGHPFHLHVAHMQVIEGCGDRYEEGEYYDTIQAEDAECKVRFRPTDFAGRYVFHCHIAAHEDKDAGMMSWVNVTEPARRRGLRGTGATAGRR